MLNEFKEFIAKGNVMDMAVGIIMGAAFTAIVNSMVSDLMNPVLGLFMGGVDFSNMFVNLSGEEYTSLAAAQEAGAATFNYGLFINAVINFMIIAFVVFMLIKGVNKLKRETEEEVDAKPEAPQIPADVALLTEIRDLMAAQKKAA